jgi:Uma2 family endonuclease
MVAEVILSPAPTLQPANVPGILVQPDSVQRVLLQGISWETYERLIADFVDSHAAHFTYDQGTLEIMVLSAEHEAMKHVLALLVEVVAEELTIDVCGFGSTTFQRADLARGFEPDACFYIQNEPLVRSKQRLDLKVDPPPDLVIEIDITHPSLNKQPTFAAVGVPEIWRYDGAAVSIAILQHDQYQIQATSGVLPGVTAKMLTQFIVESKSIPRTQWLRRLRQWMRTHRPQSNQ